MSEQVGHGADASVEPQMQGHVMSIHNGSAGLQQPSCTSLPKSSIVEETEEARLQRLGRERPAVFKSRLAEIGFVFSIAMCQVLTVCLRSLMELLWRCSQFAGVLRFWLHRHLTNTR